MGFNSAFKGLKLRFLVSFVASVCRSCLIHFQGSIQFKSTVIQNMDLCVLNQPVKGIGMAWWKKFHRRKPWLCHCKRYGNGMVEEVLQKKAMVVPL
jgi:hypothetical protein